MNSSKRELRAAVKVRLAGVRDASKQGEAAAKHLIEWESFVAAKTVACYCHMQSEIDTSFVFQQIMRAGKRLALPRVKGKGEMVFHWVEEVGKMQKGAFGILEPSPDALPVKPGEIQLMLIPAMAVDVFGNRIGHGGGYYDRYLPQVDCPVAALVLGEQLYTECLPCGEHDYLIQYIITQGGILRTNRNHDEKGRIPHEAEQIPKKEKAGYR